MSESLRRARAFVAERDGSVAILFALALLVLVLVMGIAVDYGQVSLANVRLREAADSAVLQAVGDHQSDAPGPLRVAAAQTEAQQRFLALAAQGRYTNPSAQAVASATNPMTVSLTYSATVPSTFGRIAGVTSYLVSNVSSATSGGSGGGSSKYVDIYLLVDVSGSMGIGASAADQTLMGNDANIGNLDYGNFPGDTAPGCMFGCHSISSGTDAIARQDGATLRIDVVQKALQQIVAASQSASPGSIQFSLITFGDNVTVQAPLSSNFSTISNAVSNIQLAGDYSGTSAGYALNYVTNIIPTPGDGSSAAKPLVYVILATDGVENAINFTDALWTSGSPPNPNAYPSYSRSTEVSPFPHKVPYSSDPAMELSGIDPAWCQPLKTKGAQVMTLEMPYVVPPPLYGGNDPRLIYIKGTLLPIIPGELTACASQPSYHISATDPTDIIAAMNSLYSQATGGGSGSGALRLVR